MKLMKLTLFKGNGDVALALRKALRHATLNALIGLVNVAASLGFVYVSKLLIDTATGVADHPMAPNIALLCALMALRLAASVANGYIGGRNGAQAQMALRQGFFDRLMRMRWNGTETFHSGDAVNRMEEDVRVVVDFICSNLPGFILAALQLVFASVFVYLMAPQLIFILIAFMVVASVVGFLLYRPVKRLTKAIRTQDGVIQSHLQESFQNRITVKVLQGVERMTDRLAVLQGKQFADTMKRLNYSTLAQMFLRLGFMAGYTAAFVFGVLGIRKGAITFGMMTALLQLVGQVQSPLAALVRLFPTTVRFLASQERLEEIATMAMEPKTTPLMVDHAPEVRVDGLGFGYPQQRQPVLTRFSAVFPAGKMTAVVGETGVGKTTLVRLMLALLEPSEGRIAIDGIPVGINTRCNFMYVPQGNCLFSGTIRDNMLLIKPTATEEEMRQALHIAVADFVFDLPLGLDTPCYERGDGISGGQARRVAVACALLHGGNVLILDEASASLDSQTELQLVENLKRYCLGTKTIIFVSHSNRVWQVADHIVTLEK